MKAAAQKEVEQTTASNDNSFAGLDGFHAPRGLGMGMSRPGSSMASGAGSGGATGLMGGMNGGGMGLGQQPMQQQGTGGIPAEGAASRRWVYRHDSTQVMNVRDN